MGSRGTRRIILGAGVLALGLAAPAFGGGNTDIAVTDNQFAPADVQDLSFTWEWDPAGDGQTNNKHNVRQDDRFFDSGAPIKGGDDFQTVIQGAGKYHYYCEVHGSKSGGMDGVVRKYIFPGPSTPMESQIVNWSGGTNQRYDVQYRVDDRRWKNWKRHTGSLNDSFGAGDDPVNLQADREYQVRARTLKRNDFSKRSGWSRPYTVDVFP